jgi:hypothetical protein
MEYLLGSVCACDTNAFTLLSSQPQANILISDDSRTHVSLSITVTRNMRQVKLT